MKVTVKTTDPSRDATDVLALLLPSAAAGKRRGKESPKVKRKLARGESGVRPKLPLPPAVRSLDATLGGVIAAALEAGDFRGEAGQTTVLYPPRSGRTDARIRRVVLVGLGASDAQTPETLRRAGGSAVQLARTSGAQRLGLVLPPLARVAGADAAEAVTEGVVLGGYRFDRYRGGRAKTAALAAVTLYVSGAKALAAIRRAAAAGLIIAESQNVARDLSNEPGNELSPADLALAARKIARAAGLRCHVMGVPELERRKMGGVLAVGQGSARPPRVIVLEHGRRAAKARRKPTFCLVGKGITFDSGGISIKPAANMEEMKHDMGGAAAVIGALRAVALLELPIHVVGVIAAAENMPSGTAYRPGDIIRTHSGKTIEVLNTDAEGRIVLADALDYAISEWSPAAIVDLATLTGACMVALGPWASGLFGNNEGLIEKVRTAGDASGERAWPMPLYDEHRTAMHSTIADLKNTGGRNGGASTAAGFLAAFVGDTPWVHLDIAGTGWTSTQGPYQPKGGTGVGVRLLVELLRAWKP